MQWRTILWQMGMVILMGATALITFSSAEQTQNTKRDIDISSHFQSKHFAGSNSWECWNEANTGICNSTLEDVFMLSDTDGWAIGASGVILHWNGSQWQYVPTPQATNMNSVQMSSSDNGWAVGYSGTILHWDGISWSPITSPITQSLYSLSVLSATDAWTVGGDFTEGVILHWDGNVWAEVSTPSTGLLYGVDMISPTDGWAVGISSSGGESIILHWDGVSWTEVSHPTAMYLTDIDMITANDGWAVGNSLLHWDGNTWTAFSSMFAGRSISMVSTNDGWAVGGQYESPVIKHWDGSAWMDVTSPVETDLVSIDMITGSDGWIVGRDGVMMRWNGNEWEVVNSLPTTLGNLWSVKMLSANHGWAVGDRYGLADTGILQWNGTQWVSVSAPTSFGARLNAVDALSATNAVAVGTGGIILHWDGNHWIEMSSPTTNELHAIELISPTEGWIVGYGGIILRWDGSNWVEIPSPVATYLNLYDIDMITADDGWAVGWAYHDVNAYHSVLIYWDGSNWIEFSTIYDEQLESVDMVTSTDGWAVGSSQMSGNSYESRIRHWNGDTWLSTPINVPTRLNDIDMSSTDDGWIVGDSAILHWDGYNWSETETSPLSLGALAVDMISSNYGWATGRRGQILRYEVTVPPSVPTNLQASNGTYIDRVRIGWDWVSGATSYIVYRNTSNNSNGRIQIGSTSSSTYDDTSAQPGQIYYYWVRAQNSFGTSDYSISDSGHVAQVGTVVGVVRNSGNNQPVANATITVGGKIGTTNGSGQYSIANIPTGTHVLRATAVGYNNYQTSITVNPQTIQRDLNLNPIPVDGFKLPFPNGTRYRVNQGYGGIFSHTGPYYYSLDWGIPVGYEIVAARGGMVTSLKENSNSGGCSSAYKNDANFVTIQHADGTKTQYVHLQHQSVPVTVGQTVQRGQVIGRVGLTGWVCGAHLHYHRMNSPGLPTIPTQFMDVTSNDGIPVVGNYYTSGNAIGSLRHFAQLEQGYEEIYDTPQGIVQFWLMGNTIPLVQLFASDHLAPVTEMRLASSEADLSTASWQPYTHTVSWDDNIIFAEFKTSDNRVSTVYSDTIELIAYDPIDAQFSLDTSQICTDELVEITNLTTPYCEQCGWNWDFGTGLISRFRDPSTGEGLNVWQGDNPYYGVVYAEPGEYTITLTASGATNNSSQIQTITVVESPSAEFTLSRQGNTVVVQALNTNASSWEWDFGDGETATGTSASHTYANLNDPIVITLTVYATNGCSGQTYQILQDYTTYLPLVVR